MNRLVAALVALLAFGTIAYAASEASPWQDARDGYEEDVGAIADDLFTDHVVALEVLGVLLTAAMIGALVIARPLTGVLDKSHYPRPGQTELERTQAVSNVDATFAPPPRVSELMALDAMAAGLAARGGRAGADAAPVVTDAAPAAATEEEE